MYVYAYARACVYVYVYVGVCISTHVYVYWCGGEASIPAGNSQVEAVEDHEGVHAFPARPWAV